MRRLSEQEISRLEAQACTCSNWSKVSVADKFSTDYVKHVHFSGDISLGVFEKEIAAKGGIVRHSGIFHATLHNCTVGNNVFINKINCYIANYNIEDDCFIENTELIVTDGVSSFGNGTEISLLNEGGGREILMCDQLGSQLAYIMAIYRHNNKCIDKIRDIILDYSKSISSSIGKIGKKVRIVNCGRIENVRIGDFATIEETSNLSNGSINSNESDPVYIGQNVIAKNFIISSGSVVTDASLVENTFIGQGVQIGKHFSIYDSVYFSNCQGFHGEACAIFGGPYTVTHHKSSLLIAGMFSFLNAGSGSNQSNHMYKLGPMHQGIVERGSKTTSDSYILWPAKVGAFSLVMGRHTQHSDTSSLPFSYLIENDNSTYIVPGVNLKSVGTVRDAQKWPKRDRRKDPVKLDCINFNLLSPYTIQKMYAGIDVLNNLQLLSGETSDTYSYQSTKITNSALNNGLKYYNMAIEKFLGNSLIKKLEGTKFKSIAEIRTQLKPSTQVGLGEWVDLSGMIVPKSEVTNLLNDIENGKVNTINDINERFRYMHSQYYNYEWTWALDKLEQKLGKPYTQFTVSDIIAQVETWRKSVVDLDKMLYEDAKKEFNLIARTGFGTDGGDEEKLKDFENVRGKFESNPFVTEVKAHIKRKSALGQELIDRIKDIES
ncbi:MAG: DUF4954 family protein [Paludibacteraceae bacterium]|nr:DUF4954 family protein [Paludibacteraceae bacterium]